MALQVNRHRYLPFTPARLLWIALVGLLPLGIWGYYHSTWHTFGNYVAAMDHDTGFLVDFVRYYYPTARQIFTTPVPAAGFFYSSFFAMMLATFSWLDLESSAFFWLFLQCAFILFFVASACSLLNLRKGSTLFF